ncbi:hypothetical protein [Niastella populi]|nr:hypothetical protein [Niastella populi]
MYIHLFYRKEAETGSAEEQPVRNISGIEALTAVRCFGHKRSLG